MDIPGKRETEFNPPVDLFEGVDVTEYEYSDNDDVDEDTKQQEAEVAFKIKRTRGSKPKRPKRKVQKNKSREPDEIIKPDKRALIGGGRSKKTISLKQIEANRRNGKLYGGRPRTVFIDWEMFDKLCMLQLTQVELCDFFECGSETMNELVRKERGMDFQEYYQQKTARGKMSLRRAQYLEAVDKRNSTMMIWLGKQYLGQADKFDQTAHFLAENRETKHLIVEARVPDDAERTAEVIRILSEAGVIDSRLQRLNGIDEAETD